MNDRALSKFSARWIAYIAVLTAMSVILNAVAIPIGVNNAISLTYIPNFVAGFYFGPAAGFFTGVIGDGLGCIIWPKGDWLPLMTLANGLMGLIPGLLKKLPIPRNILIAIIFVVTFAVSSVFLNTFALWWRYARTKKTFWVYLTARAPLAVLTMVTNLVITYSLIPIFDRVILPRIRGNTKQKEEKGETETQEG